MLLEWGEVFNFGDYQPFCDTEGRLIVMAYFFFFFFLALLSLLSGFVSHSLTDLRIHSVEKQACFLEGESVLHTSRCRLSCSQTVVLFFFFSSPSFTSCWIFSLERAQGCTSWSQLRASWCAAAAVRLHLPRVDTEVHIKGAEQQFNGRKQNLCSYWADLHMNIPPVWRLYADWRCQPRTSKETFSVSLHHLSGLWTHLLFP